MAAIYPADTFQEGVDLTIEASNQLAQVVRGDANTVVTVADGSTIPSIRKAQADSMYFKEPELWTTGQTETDYLQLKKYINHTTNKESWWFAKSATVLSPVAMGTSPFGDDNWTLYTPEDLFISGKAEYESIYQALKGKAAEAGYNLVRGSFEEGGTLTGTSDVLWYQANGKYYNWFNGSAKTVVAGSTPETTGGIGAGAWVDRTDVTLRSELLSADGEKLIGECPNMATLRMIESEYVGQRIRLKSYYSDIDSGGDREFRSVTPAGHVDNGGTIIVTSGGTVWQDQNIYDITLEDFGARDGEDNTEVFGRAINSPATRVTTKLSELILTENSIFTRGNINIDMPDTTVLWNAVEGHIPDRTGSSNPTNYRFPGIIAFRGSVGSEIDTFTLTNTVSKGDTTFWCTDNTLFTERQWVIMSSDVGSGTVGREINVMTQVQGSGGAITQLRVDYKTGWPLLVGRVLTYKNVTPLENIKVKFKGFKWNQNITDASGSGDGFISPQSCALVSLEYVNNADISLGEGNDHPYPMLVTAMVRRVNMHDSETNFPRVPGSDHVVQFNNAYQCVAERLHNISGRHVVDFSGASYCEVKSCGETGTRNGAFTMHGMFEHNISFEDCYGLLSIANSGTYYGESADMISVRHHFGDYLIATAKVTNLNIEHAIFTKGARVNNDANTLTDVTVGANSTDSDKGLRFTQSSSVYGRGAKVVGGDVILSTESRMALPSTLTQPVIFDKSYIRNFNAAYIGGATVSFIDCQSSGSGSATENIVEAIRFSMIGGTLSGTGFIFQGVSEQVVKVHGVSQLGSGASGLNSHFTLNKDSAGSAPITFSYKNNVATLPTGTKAYSISNAVGAFRVHSTGNIFQGGSIEFQTTIPSGGSYLNHTGNVERGVTRLSEPTNTTSIVTTGNMVL